MLTFMDWLMFIPASILISLSFGPNNFMSVVNGMRFGPVAATKACTGRVIVFAAMVVITAAGLGILLATSKTAFEVIKWCGVAYLAYLGIKIFMAKSDESLLPSNGEKSVYRGSLPLMKKEFMIAAANPKAILVMTAVLPQFISMDGDYFQQFMIIGVTFLATEFIAAWTYGMAGHFVGTRNFGAAMQQKINHATGGMFLIFAALLAFAEQES
ncbi:LysE family translocator [Terasakiella sp. A23]|uniref:LysE family translocator n=1 Tax=Terasakiella sp. FCG-A23 TaxID=3080561 RepID=UPI0029531DED|nr:LysE family translocator [Terasakiella sp. A23]MDV7338376.1 LysE family translocator [Terasakiella sp. A23]